MDINLEELSLEFSNNIKFDYNLKKKNWFNIGGKTKIYFKANNLKELINFLKKIENKEKIFILGGGSNILRITYVEKKQLSGWVQEQFQRG